MNTHTTINEAEIVEAEKTLHAQREEIDAKLQQHARDRREIARRIDANIGRDLNREYRQALSAVEETECQIAAHRAALVELTERQKAGDRSVKASDLRAEKDQIEALENYLVHDDAALRKAESAWEPYAADNHLAEFAADVLEQSLDLPVLIRTDASDAPDISPSIILSQRTATRDYGEFSPSGKVAMKVVGEPEIDWRVVQLAFEDAGSDVQVAAEQIKFDRIAFPLPVLARPARGEVTKWATAFSDGWHAHVEVFAFADRMRAAGYSGNGATGLKGFSKVISTDLSWDGGVATGIAKLSLATTENLTIDELTSKAAALVEIFRTENVGTHTAAGEIEDISLIATAAGDRTQWNGTFYRVPPQTVDVTIRLDYRYEAPATGIVGD